MGGPNLPRDRILDRALNCGPQQAIRPVSQQRSVHHYQRRMHSLHDPTMERLGPAIRYDCHADASDHACQHCDQKNANGSSGEYEAVQRALLQTENSHAHDNAEQLRLGAAIAG